MKLRIILEDKVLHTFKDVKKVNMYGDNLEVTYRNDDNLKFLISSKIDIEVVED